MTTIYIDSQFRCHVSNPDGTFQEIILSDSARTFFSDKCTAFIEGYRFVPSGETWVREDGVEFHGEMISPWKPYAELETAQREHERQLLAEYESALAEIEAALGV